MFVLSHTLTHNIHVYIVCVSVYVIMFVWIYNVCMIMFVWIHYHSDNVCMNIYMYVYGGNGAANSSRECGVKFIYICIYVYISMSICKYTHIYKYI